MKKGLTLGFKMQVEQYQPIEVTVYCERERVEGDGWSAKDLEIHLAKECTENLERISRDVVAAIQKIKAEIYNDLSDGD